MANADFDAILTRIREVIEDGSGTLRVISSARFQGQLPSNLNESEASLRAMDKPVVEARTGTISRHPASPPIFGNLSLLNVEFVVMVIRHLSPDHKLDDDLRDDIKALAANDADHLMQALTFPGNLTQTTGSVATNLVSGLLTYDSSDEAEIVQEDVGARIVTEHRFAGVVQTTLAIA